MENNQKTHSHIKTIYEIIIYYELEINGKKVLYFGEMHDSCKWLETSRNMFYPNCPADATTAYDIITSIINKYKDIPNKVGLYIELNDEDIKGEFIECRDMSGMGRLERFLYLQIKYKNKLCNNYYVDVRNYIENDFSHFCWMISTSNEMSENFGRSRKIDIEIFEFHEKINKNIIEILIESIKTFDRIFISFKSEFKKIINNDIIYNCLSSYLTSFIREQKNFIINLNLTDEIFKNIHIMITEFDYDGLQYFIDKISDEKFYIQALIIRYLHEILINLNCMRMDLYTIKQILNNQEDIKIFYGGAYHVENQIEILQELQKHNIINLNIVYKNDNSVNDNRIIDQSGFNLDF